MDGGGDRGVDQGGDADEGGGGDRGGEGDQGGDGDVDGGGDGDVDVDGRTGVDGGGNGGGDRGGDGDGRGEKDQGGDGDGEGGTEGGGGGGGDGDVGGDGGGGGGDGDGDQDEGGGAGGGGDGDPTPPNPWGVFKNGRWYQTSGLKKQGRNLTRYAKGGQKKSETWKRAKIAVGNTTLSASQLRAAVAASQPNAHGCRSMSRPKSKRRPPKTVLERQVSGLRGRNTALTKDNLSVLKLYERRGNRIKHLIGASLRTGDGIRRRV